MDKFFWPFIGIWCGAGSSIMVWFRCNTIVAKSHLSEAEVMQFAKGNLIWIMGFSLSFWILQLTAGEPYFTEYWKWQSPQREIGLALQILIWLALLYWLFFKQGADTVSAIHGGFAFGPSFLSSPAAIKISAIAMVISNLFALLLFAT